MKKLSKEQLAEISVEIFANNQGDRFFATEDGTFFPDQKDAVKHSNQHELEIHVFERPKKESEELPSLVSEEEIENFLNHTFSKISEGTGFSVEDLKAMVNGKYVKSETEKPAETETVNVEFESETVLATVSEEVKQETKEEVKEVAKPAETTAKKGTKK